MNWDAIVNKVTPYIVRIETPQGHGTGFLCFYNRDKSFYGIATARHVVSYADEWQQPIKILAYPSFAQVFLKESPQYIIFSDYNTDSAVILLSVATQLKLPETIIPLLPTDVPLTIGTEVGWLGFPSVAPYDLCFFSGMISAWQEGKHTYLIDGVAIEGVSGGPVIYATETEGVQIIGIVSAYVSNTALPGLAIARDVSHFHDTISKIQSMDDAREQKQKQEQEKKSQMSASPSTEPPRDPD
ncbi:MAG: serine protease [Acidobacteriia bacterium]|nr:serine protease [Terriglobia bacterium]